MKREYMDIQKLNDLRNKYKKITNDMKMDGLRSEDLIALDGDRFDVEREIIRVVMED